MRSKKEGSIKRNRVFGVRGIRVINGSLNAGFDGRPKTLSDGRFINSDVSSKFLDRQYMSSSGENVLVKKVLKIDDKGEMYSCTFEEILKDSLNDRENVYKQLLNDFVDVQNFGATVTKPFNFGVTGVVQYNQGINKIEESNVITQDIISPFGTGNNKKAKKQRELGAEEKNTATNIGKHSFIDDALYIQSFSVNPYVLNGLASSIKVDGFNGYKEKSYQIFKKAVLMSATVYNSRGKVGCSDEFAMFVNMKEGSIRVLHDIGRGIKVEVDDGIAIIDMTSLEYLNDIDEIESIEIYNNERTSRVVHNLKNAVSKDIVVGW